MMEFEPTVQISSCYGGYIVKALSKCDCDNPECSGWKFSDHIITDLDQLIRFTRQTILEVDAQKELSDAVESKLRK